MILFWKLPLEREHFLGTIAIFKFIFGLFWFILKQICLFRFVLKTAAEKRAFFWVLLLLLRSFLVYFGSLWKKSVCFSFFKIHSKHQNIPKHTETKFSLVSKMNRNKRETDPVSVIFGSNLNFFLFVLWTRMYTVKDLVIMPLFHDCIQ